MPPVNDLDGRLLALSADLHVVVGPDGCVSAVAGTGQHALPIGTPFLSALHPDDQGTAVAALAAVAPGRTTTLSGRLQWEDQWVPLQWRVAGLPEGGWLGTGRDVRPEKHRLATVAHELRTPLTSIRGSLGLLVGGAIGGLEGEARDLVGVAFDNTARLLRLVEELLAAPDPTAAMGRVDLREVVRTVSTEVMGLGGGSVSVSTALPPTPCPITGHPDRLVQLLLNLVGNAIRVSPPGGTVSVALQAGRVTQRIIVSDQGPGIPEAIRDRLFEPYVRGAEGGAGLGLAIVRDIAEAHGGQVQVARTGPGGTIFEVLLPVAPTGTAA